MTHKGHKPLKIDPFGAKTGHFDPFFGRSGSKKGEKLFLGEKFRKTDDLEPKMTKNGTFGNKGISM